MNRDPVIRTVQDGNITAFNDIIKSEKNVRLMISKHHLLHVAARFGHVHLVDILLQNGATIDYKDPQNGRLALHDACISGSVDIVERFCEINPEIVDYKDKCGLTAAHVCAKEGELECLKILQKYNCNMIEEDNDGMQLIHWSAKRDHKHIIRYLFELDMDMNCQTNDGKTALHLASDTNSYQTVECLLKCHADPSLCDKSKFQFNPLHIAAKQNSLESVRLLVGHGVPIDTMCADGRASTHLAAQYGASQSLHWLLKNGANIDAVDNCGNTIGHAACQGGFVETIYCFLNHGGNGLKKNNLNEDIRQYARRFGNPIKLDKAENSEICCQLCLLESNKRKWDQLHAPPELIQSINKTHKVLFRNPLGTNQKIISSHVKNFTNKKREDQKRYLETINIGKEQGQQKKLDGIPGRHDPSNHGYRDLVTRFYGEFSNRD